MQTEFREATHTYYIKGLEVAGVTATIGPPKWKADEFYLQRGQAIHKAALMIGQEKQFDYDPRIEGHITALRRFSHEVNPEVINCEEPLFSELHGFGGTLDFVAMIDGRRVIGDYKSSLEIERLKLQLGGYSILYEENRLERGLDGPPKILTGVGVELLATGRYKMTELFDLRKPRREFLTLLSADRIRKRLGGKNGTINTTD